MNTQEQKIVKNTNWFIVLLTAAFLVLYVSLANATACSSSSSGSPPEVLISGNRLISSDIYGWS